MISTLSWVWRTITEPPIWTWLVSPSVGMKPANPVGCATIADCMAPAVVGDGLRSYAAAASSNARAGIRSASAAACATRRSTSDDRSGDLGLVTSDVGDIAGVDRDRSLLSRHRSLVAGVSLGLAGIRTAIVGTSRLDHREAAGHQREHRSTARRDGEPSKPPVVAVVLVGPCRPLVGLLRSECLARRDELGFDRAERAGVGRRPRGNRFESRAAVELAVVTPGIRPRLRCGADVADEEQPVTVLVDPGAEPIPRRDQCFVGDLDGRLTRLRVPIERQQPGGTEPLEHVVDRGAASGQPVEFAPLHAAPRVARSLADSHQTGEHPPYQPPLVGRNVGVHGFGTTCQPAFDATHRFVGMHGESVRISPIAEFDEGVLQERE